MQLLGVNRLYLSMENKKNYVLKPVSEENKAALPKEIRVIMFFAAKNYPIPQELLDDCYERFNECFEPDIENQLRIE